jgi:hypothetical protein
MIWEVVIGTMTVVFVVFVASCVRRPRQGDLVEVAIDILKIAPVRVVGRGTTHRYEAIYGEAYVRLYIGNSEIYVGTIEGTSTHLYGRDAAIVNRRICEARQRNTVEEAREAMSRKALEG